MLSLGIKASYHAHAVSVLYMDIQEEKSFFKTLCVGEYATMWMELLWST
jgi:hypothetical protein